MGSTNQDVAISDVVIVGAGFSGIYGLYQLRKKGLSVQVLEAADDLGGVWYWNRYPGARVDSETPFYQLSIPEVWEDFNFTCRFPDHSEIRRYFAHADKVLNLKKDITFRARVNSCIWNEETATWTVRTEQGYERRCRYLLLFTGLLHRSHFPEFAGIENYQKDVYHSASWPENLDTRNKRVAVIGAGATSVQIVQELSKEVSQLSVLMRRPSFCLPLGQRDISEAEQSNWKPYYQTIFKAGRQSLGGYPRPLAPKSIWDATEEERERYFESLWRGASFNFGGGNYPEMMTDIRANRIVYDFWAKKIRARMTDPVKRNILAPLDPPYPFLTKRSPLEHDYYESIDRPNVELVDLNTSPIETFTETGILTKDGKHREFDFVVLATGFESFTGS